MGMKHALVVPVNLHAHFFGIYRHAVELAKKGVTITFLSVDKEIALLKTFEELQGLDFHPVSYEELGCEKIVSVGDPVLDTLDFEPSWKRRFQPILDKLMADRKAGLPGPTCIIGDRFLTAALDVARELGVPYYQFWSCGATFVRAQQAYAALQADGTLTYKTGPRGEQYLAEYEGYLNIPGLPPLEYREGISPPPQDTKGVVVACHLATGINVGKADGLIVNSFYELETPQIDALQDVWKEEESQGRKIPKLYLVGPVSFATPFKNRSLSANVTTRENDCLQWLDNRPPKSVVYFAVGSTAAFYSGQIKEVALALEASEQSFLWVLRRGEEHLPPNFATRNRARGLIVSGWVPQLQVLQHSSTGAFVTHCGWNSIIESISSGVPMAAWPQLNSDQFINCRHLVDVLKVAIEVRSEDPDPSTLSLKVRSTPPGPKKYVGLEKAVRLLLSEEGNALRARVQDLQKKAEAAIADGGPSRKALKDIVESIPS